MSQTEVVTASVRHRFGAAFWSLNTIEMFERLAYFSIRVMAPIYIMQASNPGGLHLTARDKGSIYAWWSLFASLLPIVTGGFADRYGYKRTLVFAFTLMTGGYVMAAFLRDIQWWGGLSNYWIFFIAIMTLATGTAFFKPALQGSIAQSLDKSNSSVGWGIFYWTVNIGGFIGPFLATKMLVKPPADVLGTMSPEEIIAQSKMAWRNLFLAGAGISSLNFFMLLTFKDVPTGAAKSDGPLTVLARTFTNILDARLISFLAIMSGFWLMMYQLWDLHPNFIEDWVDSSKMAGLFEHSPKWLREFMVEEGDVGPRVPQAILLDINAACIILFVIPVSWLVRRMRTLSSMLIGMCLATGGILVSGLTGNGWILALGIVLFSAGEMTTGPKKNEYLGLIAPPGKKGLYLGYVNIPVGIGTFIGSKIAGYVYGEYGEKATLALRYMKEHDLAGASVPGDPEKYATPLEAALHITRPEAMGVLQKTTGLDAAHATQLLWDTYHPQLYTWLPFAAVGVASAIALAVFGQMAKRWSDMNA
jgi:MFS family permease